MKIGLMHLSKLSGVHSCSRSSLRICPIRNERQIELAVYFWAQSDLVVAKWLPDKFVVPPWTTPGLPRKVRSCLDFAAERLSGGTPNDLAAIVAVLHVKNLPWRPWTLVGTNSPLSLYVPEGLTEKVILDGHCPLYCNSSFFAILQHHIMGNGLDSSGKTKKCKELYRKNKIEIGKK